MKTPLLILALAAIPGASFATPFEKGDAKAGKAIVEAQCTTCHAARFGGDGSKIYTRPDHKMKTASQLAQQITTCNANLGNNLFPEDELNIGAYLNQTYYKFK